MALRSSTFVKSLVLTLALSLVGVAPVLAEPANLSMLKQQLKQYHDSGKYIKEFSEVTQKADQFILQQARQNKNRQALAIILDIDETSLSNYHSMIENDFSGNFELFHKAVLKGDAPAFKPMLKLYNDALKNDVKVFFITGRTESERTVTVKNLCKAGYKNWSGLYLRNANDNKLSAAVYKTRIRSQLSQKGYKIIASIGDQVSDFKGGYTLRGFKLPNPYYYIP